MTSYHLLTARGGGGAEENWGHRGFGARIDFEIEDIRNSIENQVFRGE